MINFAVILRWLGLATALGEAKQSLFGSSSLLPTEKKKNYNGRDTTKLTDYHKSVILTEYRMAQLSNIGSCKKLTHQDIADHLNKKLGLNKSVKSYSLVWKETCVVKPTESEDV